MSVLNLLRVAGALPLAQLNMRSPGTPNDLIGELQALVEDGLVSVEGGQVPKTAEQIQTGNALVRLTRAGTSRAFR